MFDAEWAYFTKLPMIICYVLMFYEASVKFSHSTLVQTFCISHVLKESLSFWKFNYTHACRKHKNIAVTRLENVKNILIFHQSPLQHPISSLSASQVIFYREYGKVY